MRPGPVGRIPLRPSTAAPAVLAWAPRLSAAFVALTAAAITAAAVPPLQRIPRFLVRSSESEPETYVGSAAA
jgi:hypothetical protein